MKFVVKKYLLAILSLLILTQLVTAFSISGGWYGVFYASLILSLLLYIVRPIINLVMLPINLVTLNLSNWIVYLAIFFVWTILVPGVKITSWEFGGFRLGPVSLSATSLVWWQVTLVLGVFFQIIHKFLEWIFK